MNKSVLYRFLLYTSLILIFIVLFFLSSPSMNFDNRLAPMSLRHLLGTDMFGRDIFIRLIINAHYSISISLLTVCATAVLSTIMAIIALCIPKAYAFLAICVNILIAIPPFIICLLFISRIGEGIVALIIGQCLAFIPVFFRLAYKELHATMQKDFALTALGLGNSIIKVIATHGLPFLLPKMRAQMVSMLAIAIGIESGLSYLGLGLPLPNAGLGHMLQESLNYWNITPLYFFSTLITFFIILGIIRKAMIKN